MVKWTIKCKKEYSSIHNSRVYELPSSTRVHHSLFTNSPIEEYLEFAASLLLFIIITSFSLSLSSPHSLWGNLLFLLPSLCSTLHLTLPKSKKHQQQQKQQRQKKKLVWSLQLFACSASARAASACGAPQSAAATAAAKFFWLRFFIF